MEFFSITGFHRSTSAFIAARNSAGEFEPQVIELPQVGLIEGPFMFERNGTYYLSYPHVQNKTERLEYATASSPVEGLVGR